MLDDADDDLAAAVTIGLSALAISTTCGHISYTNNNSISATKFLIQNRTVF